MDHGLPLDKAKLSVGRGAPFGDLILQESDCSAPRLECLRLTRC